MHLPGPCTSAWNCAQCGREHNRGNRVKCQGCGEYASQKVITEARKKVHAAVEARAKRPRPGCGRQHSKWLKQQQQSQGWGQSTPQHEVGVLCRRDNGEPAAADPKRQERQPVSECFPWPSIPRAPPQPTMETRTPQFEARAALCVPDVNHWLHPGKEPDSPMEAWEEGEGRELWTAVSAASRLCEVEAVQTGQEPEQPTMDTRDRPQKGASATAVLLDGHHCLHEGKPARPMEAFHEGRKPEQRAAVAGAAHLGEIEVTQKQRAASPKGMISLARALEAVDDKGKEPEQPSRDSRPQMQDRAAAKCRENLLVSQVEAPSLVGIREKHGETKGITANLQEKAGHEDDDRGVAQCPPVAVDGTGSTGDSAGVASSEEVVEELKRAFIDHLKLLAERG